MKQPRCSWDASSVARIMLRNLHISSEIETNAKNYTKKQFYSDFTFFWMHSLQCQYLYTDFHSYKCCHLSNTALFYRKRYVQIATTHARAQWTQPAPSMALPSVPLLERFNPTHPKCVHASFKPRACKSTSTVHATPKMTVCILLLSLFFIHSSCLKTVWNDFQECHHSYWL